MSLLSNPKTAAYFQDPDFLAKLQDIQSNPANIQKHMSDPKIMDAFEVISQGFKGGQGGMPTGPQNPETEQQMPEMPEMPGMPGMPETQFKPTFTPKAPEPEKPKEQPKKTPVVNVAAEDEKQKGNVLYKDKKFAEAIVFYDKAIELDKFNLLYRSNKAACLIELKQFEKAMEECDAGKEAFHEADFYLRNPLHLAKLIGRKGRALWLQERYDEAIKAYGDALVEAKDSTLETDLKELKRIKIQKDKEAYLNPELGAEHREKGNELFKLGKWAEAMKEFEQALLRNPKDAKAHCNKSATYIKLMEFGMALREAETAIELDPTYIKAFIRKASCHHFMKEYHKALDCFDKILGMEPLNTEAIEGKQKTQMAIATSMHQGNDEERLKRSMQDPEIQSIMMDPMVKIALQQMQASPKDAASYFTDATLGPKLQKLIQAGVLKVA